MILQALVKYYEDLAKQGEVSRPGWCQAKVSYGINLSAEGKTLGNIPLKEEQERGNKTGWVPTPLECSEKGTSTSGVYANFMRANSKYTLGMAP